MSCATEDEFSDGDICGEWVYVGDAQQPISQARTRQQSNDAIGEGMKSWDEISKAVNVSYEQTQQIDETAKIVGVSRWEVLEALGFSDKWAFIFNDECNHHDAYCLSRCAFSKSGYEIAHGLVPAVVIIRSQS